MPKKFTDAQKEAFRRRLVLGMTAHGFDNPGGIKDFSERYAGGKSPMVSQWRSGRYMPGPETVRQIARDWKCAYEWLYFGDGDAPGWWGGEVVPAFTPERRASDDVVALQIALESLAVALLQKAPGAAAVFLADMGAMCRERKFSPNHALLGRLSGIAETVHAGETKAARGKRHDGPAQRTKTGT
jgi:hypothetical protein